MAKSFGTSPFFNDAQAVDTQPAFHVQLHVGRAQRGAGPGSGWAPLTGGEAAGPLLRGAVLPGRIEWHRDVAGNRVELSARFSVQGQDGVRVEVRDRAVYAGTMLPEAMAGLVTTPELLDAASEPLPAPALLVGRLDASDFSRGRVALRVLKVL